MPDECAVLGESVFNQPVCNLRIGSDVSTGRLLDRCQVLHALRREPPAHELDDGDEEVAVDGVYVRVEVDDGFGVAIRDIKHNSAAAQSLFKRQGDTSVPDK